MTKTKKINQKKGMMAFSQILILVLASVAFAYLAGSELRFVSAYNAGDQVKINGHLYTRDATGSWISPGVEQEYVDKYVQSNFGQDLSSGVSPQVSNPSSIIPVAGAGAEKITDADKGTSGDYSEMLTKTSTTGFGNLIQSLSWAGIAYFASGWILGMFWDNKAGVKAAQTALGAGIFAGRLVYNSLANPQGWLSKQAFGGTAGKLWGMSPGTAGMVVGAGVAIIVFLLMYKNEKSDTEIITYECHPWEAPIGGKSCQECNKGDLPCSEYRCASLGQACGIVNAGTSEEKCVWINRDDVVSPEIKPWEDVLTPGYQYTPSKTVSPPDRGVKIINKNLTTGCVPAFTPFIFGIQTNEPAQCKVDYIRQTNFSEMQFYFGGSSTFKYNHTQFMSLPGPSALKASNLTLTNGENFDLFVRCRDANGNANTATFVVQFCVDEGPDTTPPEIITTNLLNGMPVAYNQTSLDLEVYVNEPAECKWSRRDQSYDKMEETMTCSSSSLEMNAMMLYKCATTLTGIKSETTNDYYFRCKDQPGESEDKRNVNMQSYNFKVTGTKPLAIKSVKPNNETIKDSTDAVKVTLEVETIGGYNEGEAICYYSETGETDSYIMFYDTNAAKHSQEFYLVEGDYHYYLKCVDLGGNPDTKEINFHVETDTSAPSVVRVYKEESYLKIVTDEKADCVYDAKDCAYLFADGTKMNSDSEGKSHFTTWNTNGDYYIKCKDEFGNEPLPNQCNIIARPFEILNEE